MLGFVELCRERHAARRGKSLSQRTGGNLDAGQFLGIGVSLKPAAELAQRRKLRVREVAAARERGVQHRRGVSLAKDETVASGPVGRGRPVVQFVEVQRGNDVGGGEGAARVP